MSARRCEVLGRPPQRGERGPAGLIRERDGHLGARGQCLEQRPFRAREVFEAVGEDRLPVPGVEIPTEALDGATPQQTAVPTPESLELVAITRIEHAELAFDRGGSEQPLFELVERPLERVDEARLSRGARVAAEIGAAHDAAHEQCTLHAPDGRATLARPGDDLLEDVVERAD